MSVCAGPGIETQSAISKSRAAPTSPDPAWPRFQSRGRTRCPMVATWRTRQLDVHHVLTGFGDVAAGRLSAMQLDSEGNLKAALQESVVTPMATSFLVKSAGLRAQPTSGLSATPPTIALGVVEKEGVNLRALNIARLWTLTALSACRGTPEWRLFAGHRLAYSSTFWSSGPRSRSSGWIGVHSTFELKGAFMRSRIRCVCS